MSEIKLFKLSGPTAVEIPGTAGGLERSLQTLIEKNLEAMLGVQFLASEYSTGKTHGGRVDTLGIDENGCPAIVEYKQAISENVVSQGLFYLDWLLDHKAELKLLVMEKLGRKTAEDIDWSDPRLICIASDFTRYDEHAVRQMDRNIDLVRYRRFGDDLLAMELVHRTSENPKEGVRAAHPAKKSRTIKDKLVDEAISGADSHIRDIYELLRAFVLGLGDDVQEKRLKLYIAFRRIKNFASIVVQKKTIYAYLKLDPTKTKIEDGFVRDVRKIGHWGTGDVEVTVRSKEDLQRAEPLIARSYEGA
jgi:predicted transport protein